jgi:PPP family 3-phenylpropionic acid transporter
LSESLVPNALYYAAYYVAAGVMMPFLPAHFAGLGLSGTEIGVLLAFGPILTCLMPPLWGHLADRYALAPLALTGGAAAALASIALLFFAGSFAPAAAAMFAYALATSPMTALLDASTWAAAERAGVPYARVRWFGSLGFVVGAFGIGAFSAAAGLGAGRTPLFVAMGAFLVALLAGRRVAPPVRAVVAPSASGAASPGALELLQDRRVRILLGAAALHWATMTPYHSFLSIHVAGRGHGIGVAGTALAFGATSEIVMMLLRPNPAPSPRGLAACFLLTALRWAVTSALGDPLLLVLVQAAHAFSFGYFILNAMALLASLVPPRSRARGQALFVALVFGVGGGGGTILSGAVYDAFGSPALFQCAAALSVLAAALVSRLTEAPAAVMSSIGGRADGQG